MSNRSKAIVAILLGTIVSGAMSPVSKIGLTRIPPFSFSFLRFFLASLVIAFFLMRVKITFDKNFLKLLIISLLPIANVAFFVLGVRTTTASIGQMLYAATPILTGIFVFLLHKENLTMQKWFFILIGLFGGLLVIILPLIEKGSLYAGDLRGNALISLGVVCFALYGVFTKKYVKLYSPFIVTSTFILLASVVFFFLSLTEFQTNPGWWIDLPTKSIVAILYVSLLGTMAGYTFHQYAIKFGGPVIGSLSFYLLPISAFASSYILLGERLTSGLVIGTVLVFISVALTTYSK